MHGPTGMVTPTHPLTSTSLRFGPRVPQIGRVEPVEQFGCWTMLFESGIWNMEPPTFFKIGEWGFGFPLRSLLVLRLTCDDPFER
jgi:hypothetical protein